VKIGKKLAAFLLAIAVWNVVTYAVFIRNLTATEGRSTGFYVAHTVLVVVNLAIAVALAVIGYKALRARNNG
jgi:hypothetical protein